MASVHKLSLPQLQRLIRERSANAGVVFLTTHCRVPMRQRHVSLALLLDVLRQGRLRRPPSPMRGTAVWCAAWSTSWLGATWPQLWH